MFLKANKRIKDGKVHYYWTLVESVRAGRRVFQRQALYLGEPIWFDPDAPLEQERRRVCDALMDAVTGIAVSLPPHTVVPYPNVPKRDYPTNVPKEAAP
ncbi:MAG: hypothetical protein IJQ00_09545 [Kiritimatiellae bacterium]|nr:hypothetical protein [Kiritimatiellia bacterium]